MKTGPSLCLTKLRIPMPPPPTQAREMDISDLEAFYASDLFTANHFRLDPSKGAIIRQF